MNESDDSQGLFRRNFPSHASGRQKKHCTDFWSDFQSEWQSQKLEFQCFMRRKPMKAKLSRN